MPKVYMGIGYPTLIKSQENWCLRVVHVFETFSFWFQEKAKVSVSSCTEMSWWKQNFNTPLWLRNTEHRDLETKSHFNSHPHTSRSSLESCSEGASARASLSSCTAFEIGNLMLWKAEILWVLDVIWMLSSAPMNGKKIKISSFAKQDIWKADLNPRVWAKPVRIWVIHVWRKVQEHRSSRSPWHHTKEERPESPGPETLSVHRGHLKWSL